MDRSTPETVLPAMSYTSAEVKPRAASRPTEAQVRERAHLIWLEREGEAENSTLDWLQAELELESELRTGRPTPGRAVAARAQAGAANVASIVEARPEQPVRFAREDAPRRRARAA